MPKFLKITVSSFFIILFTTFLNAEENFCLDNDGLILPLFDETECLNSNDLKITKNEFINIINFDEEDRKVKLKDFRNNKNTENLKSEDDIKVVDAKKIKDEAINKIKSNKIKQERLAKENKKKKIQELKKQERLAKENKRKKIQKLKKQERLAKQNERKKIQKLKKQERLAKQNERKKIQELKKQEKLKAKIAKKEEKELQDELIKEQKLAKQKENKLLDTSVAKKIRSKEKEDEKLIINEELKIVLLNNKIVNYNLLPNIDGKVEIIDNLLKNEFKDLIKKNSNLALIIPNDFESFSNNVSQNQMTSRVVTGIRQIPNPAYKRLEMEIRDTEQKAYMAKREAEYHEASLYNQQSSGVGWLDVLSAVATTGASIAHQNKYYDLQNKLTNLVNQYSTTPMFLDKEVFSPYNYDVVNIKSEKKAHYDLIRFKDETFSKGKLSIDNQKLFQVAYNINPQDKRYEELSKKYHTMDNVTNWEKKKFENVKVDTVLFKFNNSSKNQLEGLKDVYAFLNYEPDKKKSFWSKLFSFDSKKDTKKNKNTASLSNTSTYEIKDKRFESVVVVKTNSGLGTGFFISEDEILTNYHVIEGAMTISVVNKNNKRSSAVVLKSDMKRDLALLKTNMRGTPVKFYTDQLKQGEMVEALGHPKGRKFSLTKGWISAIRKWDSVYSATGTKDVLFIQTDAAINSGNSGGPLFYKDKVVGVNTQKMVDTDIEGMNFAVHFSEVNQFLSR